jgi:hypothetical protein
MNTYGNIRVHQKSGHYYIDHPLSCGNVFISPSQADRELQSLIDFANTLGENEYSEELALAQHIRECENPTTNIS